MPQIRLIIEIIFLSACCDTSLWKLSATPFGAEETGRLAYELPGPDIPFVEGICPKIDQSPLLIEKIPVVVGLYSTWVQIHSYKGF